MTRGLGRKFWDAEIVMGPAAREFQDPGHLTSPYDEDPLDLSVFVSCYNEADYIIDTLETIGSAAREVGLRHEIIVVDDGSTDNSRRLVADFIATHADERIVLRANRFNKGLAQNYVDGAFFGRGKYYRLICGDNAEPRDSIVTVFKAIGQADIIVPYYVTSEGKSLKRRIISSAFTTLVNLMTGNRLHYYNGLAVHLRRNVLRWHSNTRGFGFQADLLCQLIDLGFSYHEVPIITIEKREGKSNALTIRNLLSVTHTLIEIGNRRLSNRLYRQRRRGG
jgi:glycosyltransferase involved in cell wall biosynthesis